MGNGEVRSTLESVASTTQSAAVRQVMERAAGMLDDRGLVDAATQVLREIARTKRAERQLLWVGPTLVALYGLILYLALVGFWRSL